MSNITQPATWQRIGKFLILRYTGFNTDSGTLEGDKLVTTYGPILAYVLARKFGVAKPVSRSLGRFGLRF